MSYQAMDIETGNTSIASDSNSLVERRTFPNRSTHVDSFYVRNKRFSRYNHALLSLLPIKRTRSEELSVEEAGLFSFITFNWIVKYLWNTTNVSIPKCPQSERCSINSARLNTLINDKIVEKGRHVPVTSIIWQFIKTRTIFACILYFLSTIFRLIGLVFLLPKVLIDPKENYTYLIILTIFESMSCILYSWCSAINLRTSIRLRSACFSSLFRHSILTSLTYKISSWQLVSFLLPEGQQIHEMIMAIPHLICTPVIILCSIGFAGYELYLWGYMSVVIILLFFPILVISALLTKNLMFKASILSDKRIRLLENFIINNLYVKYFKKEDKFRQNIGEIRRRELLNMGKVGLYDNFCFSFLHTQPIISLTVLYIAYQINVAYSNEDISNTRTQIAAVFIIMLVDVKNTLDNFWSALNNYAKGLVSLKKYKDIMILKTIQSEGRRKPPPNIAVYMEEANFHVVEYADTDLTQTKTLNYTKQSGLNILNACREKDILREININVPKGYLIGICGLPGSGKSSLLLAIMGLLSKTCGKVSSEGKFAYVSEEPVIFNDSLKNNIIFDNKLDTALYYKVLNHCCLTKLQSEMTPNNLNDLKSLTLFEKQCISLARALYAESDIYLFDNPLSTVESIKSLQIFDNCILKSLNEKTRFLVTNTAEFLVHCNEIWIMKDGKIDTAGTHDNLLELEEYKKIITTCSQSGDKFNPFGTTEENVSSPITMGYMSTEMSVFSSIESINTFDDDELQLSRTTTNSLWNTFRMYVYSFGGLSSLFTIIMTIGQSSFIALLPVSFVFCLKDNIFNITTHTYLIIFFTIFVLTLVTSTASNYFFNNRIFSSAENFHNTILQKIYSASLNFFQEKSVGIISVISLHLHLTDMELPRLLYGIFLTIFTILCCSFIITIISYWYIIPLIIFIIFTIICTSFIGKSLVNFNLFKIEIINSLYRQVVITLTARPVIQAYMKYDFFTKKLYEEYDNYITYSYIISAAKEWLILIVQFLSVLFFVSICLITAFCMEGNVSYILHFEFEMDVIFALTIVCVFQICFALQRSSVLFVDCSVAFNTLSVIQDFKLSIPTEEISYSKETLNNDTYAVRFLNVSVTHTYYTDFILNNFSFIVEDKEKMGFLNFTNIERNAIISALFRLHKIERGNIMIGTQDISTIPLSKLRSIIAVIPSEPHTFNETVMNILNPSNIHNNKDLINILEIFGLWARLEKNQKLNSTAENLNSDEKQVLMLAQAYLQRNQIIIIECLTVNSQVNRILKEYLGECFSDSTVLIFANDIECLSCCNRTVLMSNGKKAVIDKTISIKKGMSQLPVLGLDFIKDIPETSL